MRILLIAVAGLLFAGNALANGCSLDLSGTVPTQPGRGLPDTAYCGSCRDLSQFPEDFSNHAWNYTQHGAGAFTFGYYYDTMLNAVGPASTMQVRGCNTLGQCATTYVTVSFNTFGMDIMGIPFQARTSRDRYDLVTVRPNGVNYQVTHLPQTISQNPLAIPAGGQDDGYEPGTDCLDNDGTVRGESEESPTPNIPDGNPSTPPGPGSGGGPGGGAGGGGGGGGGGGSWRCSASATGVVCVRLPSQ